MRIPLEATTSLPWQTEIDLRTLAGHGADAAHRITKMLLSRALFARDSGCPNGETSAECQKPVSDSSETAPIVLGAVIPIACAVIVMLVLHRRIRRKQRVEDANDPHASLDFGSNPVDFSTRRPGRKGDVPEMKISQLGPSGTHTRGLSMDMLGSPYMLPAGLHGSHESLRSMSRSVQDEHDPYRPVTFARPSGDSMRSPRLRPENGSIYSASTFNTMHNESANLVANARPMSQSLPPRANTENSDEMPPLQSSHGASHLPVNASPLSKQGAEFLGPDTSLEKEVLQSQGTLPPVPVIPEEDSLMPPPRTSSARQQPAAPAELSASARRASDSSLYDAYMPAPEDSHGQPPYPEIHEPEDEGYDIDPSMINTGRFSIDTGNPSQHIPVPQEKRVSVMGLRPLPPDNPEENAEQRANRIRSFYREYFDDSKPNPPAQYEEDIDPTLLGGAIYDPETGGFIYAAERPFAQPVGRRAMTPPPGGARSIPAPHGRHFSSMSAGRQPNGRPLQKPRKKMPPPSPLKSLPTPHMLREDTMVLTPVDFAPPNTFRDTQNGRRPDSPMGTQRPFSPSVRAYSPLVSASSELSAMPSPHHLRKSGTFTGLDFAKLPRFRGQESSASDAGSIRSARSGISAMQMDAVRAGAYRVSRIPKEMVTTREDLAHQLRPKMNLISPA